MKIDLDIKLNKKQILMYNALNTGIYREVLFYGASRSGKTFLILYWFVVQCLVYKANCLIVRNTFTSLVSGMIQQTMPAVMNSIAKFNGFGSYLKMQVKGKPFAKYNGKDNVLTFYNGAYIKFASLRSSSDDDSAFDKILSTEWGHIFVDEVSEIDQKPIDTLKSRLAQKLDVPNLLLLALNPTTKLHWTYQRYFQHKGSDGEPLSEDAIKKFMLMHFSVNDNLENISEDYMYTLSTMSRMQQRRFLEGEYADEGEGEVFKKINWGDLPAASEFDSCIIYTDPSAKDKEINDYKASALLGKARNKIWLIDVRAIQGNSRQMLENIWELYRTSPIPPRIVMEKKQLPLDFETTFSMFQEERGWVCPLEWDTRNMGDKFTFIESTLEPLFRSGKFIFSQRVKDSGVCEITIDQFLRFSRNNNNKNKKDDIPDACAKGTSLLSRDMAVTSRSFDNTYLIKRGRGQLRSLDNLKIKRYGTI